MTDSDAVLGRIDDLLAGADGHGLVSSDAMRWAPPETVKPEPSEPPTRSFRMHTWEEYTRIEGHTPTRPPNATYRISSRGNPTTTEYSMWLLDSDVADLQPGASTVTIRGRFEAQQPENHTEGNQQ